MSERAELLFKKLWNRKTIHDLVGQSEDADFDCKEWHGPDNTKASIAKGVCGFANATGGVIVVRMSAKGTGANSPDMVTGEKPVSDIEAVKSAVLDIILKQVDPGIKGVEVHTVRDKPKSKSGFVLIYVPELDGPPQRSKADWRFYVRIASGTVPMEYFQVSDMFGKRPHPKLALILEKDSFGGDGFSVVPPKRIFRLGLKNEGRGIARFPCVRFSRKAGLSPASNGLDGNGCEALPRRASEYPWVIYQGGVDSIIFPGESFFITKLVQDGQGAGTTTCEFGSGQLMHNVPANRWRYPEIAFHCQVSCEGIETVEQGSSINSEEYIQPRI
jgi:hypothetical protein